jgi:hypothetical protein
MKFSLRNATIELIGGNISTEKITIKIGDGNLTFTEYQNREYTLDRGLLDEVRPGDEQPMDASFAFNWEWFESIGTEDVTPREVLNGEAGWTSTDTDDCREPSISIVISNAVLCGSSTTTEKITLPYYRNEQLAYDSKAGTISATGKCNATKAVVTARS